MAASTITVPVTFTYRSSTAQKVQVAGDWDQWSGRVDLNKVAGVQEDGQDLWQATQRVPPQTKLQYKYILNGDDWHTRDDLPTETDANGNKNNFLTSPEKEHAATDEEHKEKTTAEVVGAGITSTVGAAIATVVGTDPFAGHDQAIKSDAGLTASANGKVTSDAEKQSAVLDSGAGAPAGAAAVGASGPVPTEQLSQLGLADGKTPADAGAAAIAAAAAGTTGAVAAGQSTGEGAIHPSSLETVQKSGASTAVPAAAQQTQQQPQQTQQQGVLNQDEASKGLAAGASGDAPTVGAPANGSTSQKANDTAKTVAAGAAGVGAAVAGGAAAAAATASEKAKEAKETVQQKATSNGDNKASTGADVGAGSAATAAAGGTAAAASQQKAQPTETEKKQEQLSSGPTSTASKQPVAVAPAAAPSTSSSSNVAKDASAAAAGGAGIAATSAAAPKSHPKLTETEAKQEKLSSGPTAAPSKDPVVPSKDTAAAPSSAAATPASTTAAVAAGGAAAAGIGAGAIATGASKPQPSKPTETELKQEKLSSGPVAAGTTTPTAAPALNQQTQQQQTSAPATPAKTTTAPATPAAAAATTTTPAAGASDYPSNTAKRGSRFGTSRKSKIAPSGTTTPPTNGANEFGTSSNAASSVDPNTFPTTGASTDSQVERKSLERSRKKSGFFTRIKEKLGSPAKGKE